jgi:hypothetical protein
MLRPVNQDFLDLLSAFNAAEVRYMVVGAYAVGVHGHPRATKDLDIWIQASTDNASRVMNALRTFGAPVGDLETRDFETPGTGFMMGSPPRRIDVLTQIDGVPTKVIALDDLLTNKRAAGRLQDLADVRALERLRGLTPR